MDPRLIFRPYRPTDRGASLAMFEAHCPEFFAPNERADYEVFLDQAAGEYRVCLIDDSLVGAFGLEPYSPKTVAIRWVLVAPEAQGKGVGRAIMHRALELLRERGATRLFMAASHRSAPFFARFGAKELATISHGWGPGMHRVDMEIRREATGDRQ